MLTYLQITLSLNSYFLFPACVNCTCVALLSSRLLTLTLSLSFEGIFVKANIVSNGPIPREPNQPSTNVSQLRLHAKERKQRPTNTSNNTVYCSSKLLGYSGTRYFLSSFLCCSESTSSALLRRKALCKYQSICPAGADQMHELHLHSVLILLLWHPRLPGSFLNSSKYSLDLFCSPNSIPPLLTYLTLLARQIHYLPNDKDPCLIKSPFS